MIMLANQLKAKNPQMFNFVEQAIQNKNNPMEIIKNVTKNYTPEQIDVLMQKAGKMGIPNEVLEQVKQGIK